MSVRTILRWFKRMRAPCTQERGWDGPWWIKHETLTATPRKTKHVQRNVDFNHSSIIAASHCMHKRVTKDKHRKGLRSALWCTMYTNDHTPSNRALTRSYCSGCAWQNPQFGRTLHRASLIRIATIWLFRGVWHGPKIRHDGHWFCLDSTLNTATRTWSQGWTCARISHV